MKKLYSYLIILILGLCACETDEIETYDAGNYLQFTIPTVDTVEISFLMLGSPATYDYPVVIQHIGMPSATESKPFVLQAVDTSSTIKAGMYTLPQSPVFQPWSKLDTFYVRLTNYPELTTTKVLLCLELKSNEHFIVGDRDFRRLCLRIHNDIAKPSWWDSNTQRYLLGTYTDAKYRALVRALNERLGGADFSSTQWNTKLLWALEFKAWLEEHPEVKEDNGTDMTVPVKE